MGEVYWLCFVSFKALANLLSALECGRNRSVITALDRTVLGCQRVHLACWQSLPYWWLHQLLSSFPIRLVNTSSSPRLLRRSQRWTLKTLAMYSLRNTLRIGGRTAF